MKIHRRVIGLALALALALSLTAFADTEVNQGSSSQAGQTTVSYTNSTAYTVTIPASVTLGSTATVSAAGVAIESGQSLNVKLTATSGESNAFTVAHEDDTMAYTVKNGDTAVSIGDAVLTVAAGNTSGSQELSFTLNDGESANYAGTYSGTVTFTVSVDAG